jgi:hypothetical protein
MTHFDDIDFDTGDILLFHENLCCCRCLPKNCFTRCLTGFLDGCIDCCSDSIYNHAALVIKDPNFGPRPLKGLYVWESTGLEHVRDVEDRRIKFGVQLRRLDEVLRDYDGDVYIRRLSCVRDEQFYQNLKYAHSVAHNEMYDIDPIDWIRALFNIHQGNLQRRDTFYCSALVAFVYTSLGLMPKGTPWTIVRPADLGTESSHRSNIQFIKCELASELKIKKPKKISSKWIKMREIAEAPQRTPPLSGHPGTG